MSICVNVYMSICTYVYMYICLYVNMYICIYAYVCIYKNNRGMSLHGPVGTHDFLEENK